MNSNLFIIFISLFSLSFQGTKVLIPDLFDKMNVTFYSGYLNTDIEGNELFYMFTPSQSANPNKDPVLLWLNGGPGCSSLFGLLAEVGPVIAPLFEGYFKLNENSWSKNANLIAIEQPAGVGFSKTSDPEQQWTDPKTSTSLLAGLKDFFKQFPELKSNDFYVSGESYAGVYIPNLAMRILEDTSSDKINLKGVLIGNGLTTFETDVEASMVEFGFYHGLISIETYDNFQRNCDHLEDELRPKINSTSNEYLKVTHRCNEIRKEISDIMGGNDIYGIYRTCPANSRVLKKEDPLYQNYQNSMKNSIIKNIKKIKKHIKNNNNNNKNDESNIEKLTRMNLRNIYLNEDEEEESVWPKVCGDDLTMDRFLNSDEVKNKLQVANKSMTWKQCSDLNYEMSETLDFYSDFLPKYKDTFRVWFFSGTDDGVLCTLGTMRWIQKLNVGIKSEWKQWKNKKQIAGMFQVYDNGLTLVTVKGAGHMVPQDRSEEAKVMLDAFIKGGFED